MYRLCAAEYRNDKGGWYPLREGRVFLCVPPDVSGKGVGG